MKLWTLKFGSKSIQTSLILRQRPPKSYKLLKFFISFVTTVKSRHATSIWKKLRWKSLCLPILKTITEIIKFFKSLYGFGGRCLKIRDVGMDFEPYFKVHNLVNVHPKNIKLVQMTNINMIFYVMVSDYRLVKIWNSPQVPDEFRNGLLRDTLTRAAGLGPSNFWLVRSEHAHASYPGLFFRPHGLSPYVGREEREFRDWTTDYGLRTTDSDIKHGLSITDSV